jgi:exosortase family protein XrtG
LELAAVIPIGIIWLAAVVFFYWHRIWLLYYLVGSIGLAFIIIFVGRELFLESAMENAVAVSVHQMCNLFGIPTKIFQAAPGALLVMVITQEVGWTVVQITIECSGLLETGALAGMVLLYPGWSWRKRTILTIGGVVAIFAANIIRLLFIVDILHYTGKDSIFISHTIAGRAIFFIIVVGIYWWVLTRPTLNDIGNRLRKELSA